MKVRILFIQGEEKQGQDRKNKTSPGKAEKEDKALKEQGHKKPETSGKKRQAKQNPIRHKRRKRQAH